LENKRVSETGFAWKREVYMCWGEVAQIMYTHVSKCKNDKINLKKEAVQKCWHIQTEVQALSGTGR
jgi:hypothetical protein